MASLLVSTLDRKYRFEGFFNVKPVIPCSWHSNAHYFKISRFLKNKALKFNCAPCFLCLERNIQNSYTHQIVEYRDWSLKVFKINEFQSLGNI